MRPTPLALLSLLLAACPAVALKAKPAFDTVLYGAAYYHEYQPTERLEEDVRLMQEAGLTVVRIGESSWSGFEPEEGRFEFAWMDRIVDRLHKAGIKVIMGTPTYSIPPWLWKKHPEILIEYPDGKKVGYGIRQNVDLTQSAYRFHCERIIRKIAEHYSKHPAVIGFQVDNETLVRGAANNSIEQGFRQYVRDKFVSVEALNKAWGLNYWGMALNNWEELPPIQSVTNTGHRLEWERYKMKVIADFLGWQTRLVGEYKRPDQFVTQCFMTHPECDLPSTSAPMDIVSVNPYPRFQDEQTGWEMTWAGDYMRSVKRSNYLVTETTAQTTGWDSRSQRPPYDGQLRLNAYTAIGSGANMVEYWHWHSLHYGQETYWKGILSHDLQPNRIYGEVSKVAHELKAIGSHLVNLTIKPKVAILLSYDSNFALNIMPYRDGQGSAYWDDALPSVYRAFYNNSVPVDVIYPGRDQLKDYSLVVVPPLYAASDAALAEIDRYVKEGGHAVVMFKSGFCNEENTVRAQMAPGPLRAACGFRYQEFASIRNLPLRENPYGVAAKDNTATDWAEFIIPEGAKPLAYYEHPFYGRWPAFTRNQYGKGTLLYEGTRPSDSLQEAILVDELKQAGLRDEQLQTHFPLITKSGTNALGRRVRFVYNFSGASVTYRNQAQSSTELLGQKSVEAGQELSIGPWDLLILEDSAR
jgi:beta-galactosidase